MGTLSCKMRVLEKLRDGQILEISFRGTHEWTHGQEMEGFLKTALVENPEPVAVVFNLLDYRYVYGNDVSCFCTAAFDRTNKTIRPVAVVARGRTRDSLYNLYKSGKLLDVLGIEFVSTVNEGLELVRARVEGTSV